MKVKIQCWSCGSEWAVEEEHLAKLAACPICGKPLKKEDEELTVPEAFQKIIALKGESILQNGGLFYALLSDLLARKEKELRVLKIVCSANAYAPFCGCKPTEIDFLKSRETFRLTEEFILPAEWAEKAMGWLFEALGIQAKETPAPQQSTQTKPVSQQPTQKKKAEQQVEPISPPQTPKKAVPPVKNTGAKQEDFFIKDGVLIKYLGQDKKVVIPDGVTAIGAGAFVRMMDSFLDACFDVPNVYETREAYERFYEKNGTEVYLNRGKAIGRIVSLKETLLNVNIQSVEMPDSVVTIGEKAFYECKELKSVTFSQNLREIEDDAFYNCKELKDIQLPSGVTTIGNRAFAFTAITEINLPLEMERVGRDSFCFCKSLVKVVFSSKVKIIERGSFQYCEKLASVVLNDGLEKIEMEAFKKCPLEDIFIPKSVQQIDTKAFCDSFSGVTICVEASHKPDAWSFGWMWPGDSYSMFANFVIRWGCKRTSANPTTKEPIKEDVFTWTVENGCLRGCQKDSVTFYDCKLPEKSIRIDNGGKLIIYREKRIIEHYGKGGIEGVSITPAKTFSKGGISVVLKAKKGLSWWDTFTIAFKKSYSSYEYDMREICRQNGIKCN